MTSIGTPRINAVSMKSLNLVILKLTWLISVARSRDVVIFETSAGWNLTGPNSNQDRDPLTSTPRNITPTSRHMTNRYSGTEALSQNCALITNRIRAASPSAVSIQTNCLPERKL